jgi:excisionase family DNA binding protein
MATKPIEKQTEAPLAYRVPEFCRRIGVSPSTFWKHHAQGKIRTIRIGRRSLVPADEVARILREGVARG